MSIGNVVFFILQDGKPILSDRFFKATDLVEKLIAEGKHVVRYPLNGTWIDIGNPQEYQKARDFVKHL